MDYYQFIIYLYCLVLTKNFVSAETSVIKNNDTDNIQRYEPNWKSIDSRPLPRWYDESKIGIYIHWGVYSAVGYGSEWFWFGLKNNQSGYTDFMNKNYKKGFTYQDFAPLLTGEFFEPDQWATIIENSGAQYVVFTSKHHDGFTMWPSSYSTSWNSVDLGPHRDVVGELATSIRKKSNIKFGLYYSLFEWFNPIFLQDKSKRFMVNNYGANKVIPELKELVNRYKPDVIWSDGDAMASPTYWKSLEFLAWLYNDSPVNSTVVTNDRWGMLTCCYHGGFRTCKDHFNPGTLQPFKFENVLSVDNWSWGYRAEAKLDEFVTAKDLVTEIVTTVSCGGNVIINVAPDRFGVIQLIYVDRLADMGKWLKINGEAIYKSVPFKYQNDSSTPDVWYTKKINETESYVYAMILEYPIENTISLYSVHGLIDINSKMFILGYTESLEFNVKEDHVLIKFPPKQYLDIKGLNLAWTIKMVLQS